MESFVDLFIIGGGINGTGIAADASGRGLSVTLCEMNDLASATSSASTKLIHGGLRYLEHFEFGLVRKALKEREILLRKAPHLIHPMTFVLPQTQGQRSAWMIRLGLFIYDHLAKRSLLEASHSLDLSHSSYATPLKPQYHQGFSYSDCTVDDSRLVITNAIAAREKGANILTHCEVIQYERKNACWNISVNNKLTGKIIHFNAKGIINASGPWVKSVRLVKGSHIVTKRLFNSHNAYLLQHTDDRVIFAIPYLDNFTLIGTTELPFDGDLDSLSISQEEINYLCQIVNNYFKTPIKNEDIIYSWAGVRALKVSNEKQDTKASREYQLILEDMGGKLPIMTIMGGKITTYRRLAEDVLWQLRPYYDGISHAWTSTVPLPGGNIPDADFERYCDELNLNYSWLPKAVIRRMAQCYGTRCNLFLKGKYKISDLGMYFGHGLYEAEVRYLCEHEWATTTEDILFRRTKLGLYFSNSDVRELEYYVSKHTS